MFLPRAQENPFEPSLSHEVRASPNDKMPFFEAPIARKANFFTIMGTSLPLRFWRETGLLIPPFRSLVV